MLILIHHLIIHSLTQYRKLPSKASSQSPTSRNYKPICCDFLINLSKTHQTEDQNDQNTPLYCQNLALNPTHIGGRKELRRSTMITSCFSNPSSPTTCKSHQMTQNLVTSVYQTRLCNSPAHLTLTWSKTLHSHSLAIHASDSFSITISLHPSTFSFFRSRPGSKCISLGSCHHQIKIFWDFTRAKFSTNNSAEPDSCFYLAIFCNSCIEFFLGDLRDDDVFRRAGATGICQSTLPTTTLLSRREHVFGRRTYSTRAQLLGEKHEIGIECNGGELKVKVDGEVGLVVKRLAWKFRGNERIMVGGSDVEFYWDVYDWVASSPKIDGGVGGGGHGVFVFQVGDGGVWPEMVELEKRLMRKTISSSPSMVSWSPSPSSSSVLQWAEESSDGGRSSCASSTRSCGSGGFSLLLHAWRTD